MSKVTVFVSLLMSMNFAANAKVSKSLKRIEKGEKIDDAILAAEAKTSKAYKEDAAFAAKVDAIIAGKVEKPKAEPAKTTTNRSGEPRR
jgi:hypothetical protein